MLTRFGCGILLMLAVTAVLLHPAFYPLPGVVASHFHEPIRLEIAALSLGMLFQCACLFAAFLSRSFADRQQLPGCGHEVADLICSRLC